MDKTEGNQLIAEFMGKDYSNVDEREGMPDSLYYHSSWNDLMPVVENIEEIKYHKSNAFSVDFGRGYCVVYHNDLTQKSIIVKTGNYKIEAAWEAVVSFIQWYNEQQLNK